MRVIIERCTANTFRLIVTDDEQNEVVNIVLNSMDDVADLLKVVKI
jgi:hypothetical protein